MKHLKLIILFLLPITVFTQPAIQGFQMGFGFVRGTYDELPPGSDIDDANQASLRGRACQCGSVFLQNLSTQVIAGQTVPIGDDLVNGVYIIETLMVVQADEWQFGEVIEVPLPCWAVYSGSALNFQVVHASDSSEPSESDQIFNPCPDCRLRKAYFNTWSRPNVSAGMDDLTCLGESIQLNATGATDYAWTPSNSLDYDNIANPLASPTTSTSYLVEGSVSHSFDPPGAPSSYSRTCVNSDQVYITVDDGPDLDLPEELFLCADDQSTILDPGDNPNATYSWNWTPYSDPSRNFTVGSTQTQETLGLTGFPDPYPYGTYTVTATSNNGCESEASTEILPLTADFDISFTESGGMIQFTMTDIAEFGQSHGWGLARAGDASCSKDGAWLEFNYTTSTTSTTSSYPLGNGQFYLRHWETGDGCYKPVNVSRCVTISAIASGQGYEMIEYGHSKINESAMSNKSLQDVSAYPNPFQNSVQISFNPIHLQGNRENGLSIEKIDILDTNGKLLQQRELNGEDFRNSVITLYLENLSSGVYLAKIYSTDGSIFTKKLLKQK